jgi:hypothetical protein
MVGVTSTDRTTAAEARFVEEGHHAVLDHDDQGPYLRVVSETLGHRGIAYAVRVATAGPGRPLVFTCAPLGPVYGDGHRTLSSVNGVPPCKHAAGAARRLGREGHAEAIPPGVHGSIATRDTRWVAALAVATPGPLVLVPPLDTDAYPTAAEGHGGDPFVGFPQ